MSAPALLSVVVALAGQTATAEADESAPWWRSFGDERLHAVVDEALEQNGDLGAARARALAADVAALQALSPTLPNVSLDASGNVAPLESLGFQFGGLGRGGGGVPGQVLPLPLQLEQVGQPRPPLVYYTGSALLSARVQLDAGRSISAWRAQELEADAAFDEGDAQTLQLALQVASTYYDLVTARQQLAIVRQQIDVNREVLRAADLRFEAGEAEGLDVLQQRQNLAAVETLLPPAAAQVRVLAQQLAVLAGRPPTDPPDVALELPERLAAPASIDVNDLVERRPDVTAAKHRLEAAKARTLSALLAFAPSVGFSAQAGQQAFVIDEPRSQLVWGAGATVSLPLFSGGQRWSVWQQAERSEEAARASLRQLRLRAAQGIASGVARYEELEDQLVAARAQRDAARLALESARERYAAGLTTYQAVQLALNTTLQSELTVLSAHRQLIDALLSLHDALAGSWADGIMRETTGSEP